jgi:hypothetical protein
VRRELSERRIGKIADLKSARLPRTTRFQNFLLIFAPVERSEKPFRSTRAKTAAAKQSHLFHKSDNLPQQPNTRGLVFQNAARRRQYAAPANRLASTSSMRRRCSDAHRDNTARMWRRMAAPRAQRSKLYDQVSDGTSFCVPQPITEFARVFQIFNRRTLFSITRVRARPSSEQFAF